MAPLKPYTFGVYQDRPVQVSIHVLDDGFAIGELRIELYEMEIRQEFLSLDGIAIDLAKTCGILLENSRPVRGFDNGATFLGGTGSFAGVSTNALLRLMDFLQVDAAI